MGSRVERRRSITGALVVAAMLVGLVGCADEDTTIAEERTYSKAQLEQCLLDLQTLRIGVDAWAALAESDPEALPTPYPSSQGALVNEGLLRDQAELYRLAGTGEKPPRITSADADRCPGDPQAELDELGGSDADPACAEEREALERAIAAWNDRYVEAGSPADQLAWPTTQFDLLPPENDLLEHGSTRYDFTGNGTARPIVRSQDLEVCPD